MAKEKDIPRELAQAGELCLAFVNTAVGRRDDRFKGTPPDSELLDDYGALLTWGQRMGAVSAGDAQRLLARANREPEAAAATLNRALELRGDLLRIFNPLAEGTSPSPEDLGRLNSALKELVPVRQVAAVGDGFAWTWGDHGDALDCMLWPVLRSAADLLVCDDHRWVCQCDDPRCTRFFVDRRSRRRRWCDPNTCGSRDKGRRHYRKSKRNLLEFYRARSLG